MQHTENVRKKYGTCDILTLKRYVKNTERKRYGTCDVLKMYVYVKYVIDIYWKGTFLIMYVCKVRKIYEMYNNNNNNILKKTRF